MVFLAASPKKSSRHESRREVDVSVVGNKMVSDQPANCVTEMHDNSSFFSYPSTSLHSPRGATLKGVNFTSRATPQRQKGQNSVFCGLSEYPTTIAELQPWTIINENIFKLSEARRYFSLRKSHWLEQNIIVTTNALQNISSLSKAMALTGDFQPTQFNIQADSEVPFAVIHSFKSSQHVEEERLVLTSSSFVAVAETTPKLGVNIPLGQEWALKVSGQSMVSAKNRAGSMDSSVWFLQFDNLGRMTKWQSMLRTLIYSLAEAKGEVPRNTVEVESVQSSNSGSKSQDRAYGRCLSSTDSQPYTVALRRHAMDRNTNWTEITSSSTVPGTRTPFLTDEKADIEHVREELPERHKFIAGTNKRVSSYSAANTPNSNYSQTSRTLRRLHSASSISALRSLPLPPPSPAPTSALPRPPDVSINHPSSDSLRTLFKKPTLPPITIDEEPERGFPSWETRYRFLDHATHDEKGDHKSVLFRNLGDRRDNYVEKSAKAFTSDPVAFVTEMESPCELHHSFDVACSVPSSPVSDGFFDTLSLYSFDKDEDVLLKYDKPDIEHGHIHLYNQRTHFGTQPIVSRGRSFIATIPGTPRPV